MSVYTNRGMKVRLDTAFVFALIGRLIPKYTAVTVFQYTEGIALSPSFFFWASAIITLCFSGSPLFLLIVPPLCATLQLLMKLARAYTPLARVMMPIFRFYALLYGRGLFLIPLLVFAYIRLGIAGIGILLCAGLLKATLCWSIENAYAKWWEKHFGRLLWGSEHSLIYAFQYLAHKLGVNARTNVSLQEKESKPMFDALARLIVDHPNVYAKFTKDEYTNTPIDETLLHLAVLEATLPD